MRQQLHAALDGAPDPQRRSGWQEDAVALFITAFGPVYHAMPACKPTLLLAGEHPAHPAKQRRVVCGGELALLLDPWQ